MNRLAISAAALADILDIISYYSRDEYLPEDQFFWFALENCLLRVKENPDLYRALGHGCRIATVRRFPFCVSYHHADGEVVITAVFRESQMPEVRRVPRKD